MSIPYPGEVFGPVLSRFWLSYGDVILPLVSWLLVFIAIWVALWIVWDLTSAIILSRSLRRKRR